MIFSLDDDDDEELGVNSLTDILEKRQLEWFGDVCQMDEDCRPRKFFEARPISKIPRGMPKMSWKDSVARVGERKRKQLDFMKALAKDRDSWVAWIKTPPC